MGITTWIILSLATGLIANMAIPGKRSHGLAVPVEGPGREGTA
jgi:uncharacterized membrane protein YeaQ/YmgE (transglycosylase-associated protein family)